MKIGVLILAAGFSNRMGVNKALLKFNKDYTFLDQLVSQYQLTEINKITIISQNDSLPIHSSIFSKKIQFVKNEYPRLGRSYSIHLGLQSFKSFDFVFIQNIDNPFTKSELLILMISQARSNIALVPQVKSKNSHPILIPQTLCEKIMNERAKSFDFRDLFTKFSKRYIQWDEENIRANINTMKEYERWLSY